jgi:hypothetical protein
VVEQLDQAEGDEDDQARDQQRAPVIAVGARNLGPDGAKSKLCCGFAVGDPAILICPARIG